MTEPARQEQIHELTPEDLAMRIAEIASDKVAQDIRVFDLREIVSYTDYFVICSGGTERQTKAVHGAIYQELEGAHGRLPRRVEGVTESRWILMDYLDAVIHIFTPEARRYYRLGPLWGGPPSQTGEELGVSRRRARARARGGRGRERRRSGSLRRRSARP